MGAFFKNYFLFFFEKEGRNNPQTVINDTVFLNVRFVNRPYIFNFPFSIFHLYVV